MALLKKKSLCENENRFDFVDRDARVITSGAVVKLTITISSFSSSYLFLSFSLFRTPSHSLTSSERSLASRSAPRLDDDSIRLHLDSTTHPRLHRLPCCPWKKMASLWALLSWPCMDS